MEAVDALLGSPAGAARPPVLMPAFATGRQAHHHSLHSALATLEALGVGAHRIAIERGGRDASVPGTVVGQVPLPGEPLAADTRVHLRIAGLGFTHALPVGMWDSGGETHMGTQEILQGFDDPLEKLKHWFQEGAPLFRIAPEDPSACERWLNLFGVDAGRWPRALWYPLATLVAGMAQYSCSQGGAAFVLQTLLGLPVAQFRYLPTFAQLPDAALSGLGARASRLGVDLLMGDAAEEPSTLEIEIGPVPLQRYEQFVETPEGAGLLRQTLEMVMPVATQYRVRWSVLDRNRAPRLGVKDGNSRLGINTHMGKELGSALAEQPRTAPAQLEEADISDSRTGA